MKLKNCYRIITDSYCGYEVQVKRWWLPFWFEKWHTGMVNSFSTIDAAKEWIKDGCKKRKEVYREYK